MYKAGGVKVVAGKGLAAIVLFRTKVQLFLDQTLEMGVQLVLPS
jgi:hypothetical protein